MIALSPAVSWLLIGICLGFAAVVYVVVAGGRRYRRMEREFDEWRSSETWAAPVDAHVRIIGGIYDWQCDPESDL